MNDNKVNENGNKYLTYLLYDNDVDEGDKNKDCFD